MRIDEPASPEAHAARLFAAGHFCAEAVLLAGAKHLGVKSDLIPAIATGFCSGLARTSGLCGAVSGGVMVLGLAYGRERAGESVDQSYAATRALLDAFRAEFGATGCTELLGCDLGTPEGQQAFRERRLGERCLRYTAAAARLAGDLVGDPNGKIEGRL
jgi:C_GCAxxG_C_C family probable redox protein